MKKYAIIIDETHKRSASTVELLQEKGDKSLVFTFVEDLTSELFWLNRNQYEEVTECTDEIDLKISDRVCHCKDDTWLGEIIYIDLNLIASGEATTTCLILWDGGDIGDIQWMNKLVEA